MDLALLFKHKYLIKYIQHLFSKKIHISAE